MNRANSDSFAKTSAWDQLDADLSAGPQCLQALSTKQKLRLSEILDDYLRRLELGVPPERSELLERHSDLAVALTEYLDRLESLHDATGGLAPPPGSSSRQPSGQDPDIGAFDETTVAEKRLGDFVLLREVGRGGMGVVYEARQLSLGRRVALKVLPFAAVLDSQQIARFKNEAHAAAQLHHPNIVPVFAVGTDRGVHYFAMQFIEGQTLECALAEIRSLDGGATTRSSSQQKASRDVPFNAGDSSSLREAFTSRREYFRAVMRLGIQAAGALQEAHDYGILHRDIKPSNLMLDNAGKLWVTDFGLARCQSDLALTRTGDVVGTLRYMSPEQATGKAALVDQRSDIYSLGATLYELLTLRPAFDAEEGVALRRQIEAGEPPRARQLQPHLPLDLETVVAKAMSPQREDRYLSAREFADDLRRVLDGKPTVARPPTALDRIFKWTRRHSRAVAALAATCVVIAVGLSASVLLIGREKGRAERNLLRAERHFKQAQQAVDRFGSRLAERLADVSGAEEVRRELLNETLAYYRAFVDEAQFDPTLRAELAQTYSKIGSLADEIGSTKEALEAHREATGLFERLVAENPAVVDYRRRLGVSKNNLAMVLHRQSSGNEALAALEDAIGLQRKLYVSEGSSPEQRLELATSYSNLGLVQSDLRRERQARSSYAAAIELLEEPAPAGNLEPERMRHLAATYNNQAGLTAGDDPQGAAEMYQNAATCQTEAALARPDDLKQQSALAMTLNNLGAAQSRLQRFDDATTSLKRAIELQEVLARAAPLNRTYRRDLAVSYNNLGRTQTKAMQLALAEASFRRALQLQGDVARDCGDAESQSCLGGIYNNLGMAQEEDRRLNEAAESYRAAIEHQRRAFAAAKSVQRYRSFLSKHYFNYGRTLRKLDRPEEAVQTAIARKDLWPGDPRRIYSVAEELGLATQLMRNIGRSESAVADGARLTESTLRAAEAAGFELPKDLSTTAAFTSIK